MSYQRNRSPPGTIVFPNGKAVAVRDDATVELGDIAQLTFREVVLAISAAESTSGEVLKFGWLFPQSVSSVGRACHSTVRGLVGDEARR